jgi:hypothetical protein
VGDRTQDWPATACSGRNALDRADCYKH